MFNLEQSIAEWRQRMLVAGITAPVPLEELEEHLREQVARQTATGRAEEVAFGIAVEGLGHAEVLRAEFRKIEAGQWSRPLLYVAWGIFAVSFVLPSYSDGAGWRCAGLSASLLFDLLFRRNEMWGDCHLALLTLANVVMVTSPLLLRLSVPAGFAWNLTRTAAIGSVVLVWSFLIRLACSDVPDMKIGTWVWGASFVLLCVAMFKVRNQKWKERYV